MEDVSNFRPAAYRGLCSTCKHASECTFPRDPNRPVMQCEEFEGILYAPEETRRAQPLSFGGKAPKTDEEEPTQLKGLCKLCENRSTCTYPKPEGGVWHCVEYK